MSLESTITDIITPLLQDMGFAPVQVRTMGGYNPVIQIMIERLDETLTTVDDCADASRAISALLDVEDPVPNAYTLEVSTAGIDRPLVRVRDFERYTDQLVKLEILTPLPNDNRRKIRGFIAGVDGDNVLIRTDTPDGDGAEESPLTLAHANIKWAKLVLTDDLIAFSKTLYESSAPTNNN